MQRGWVTIVIVMTFLFVLSVPNVLADGDYIDCANGDSIGNDGDFYGTDCVIDRNQWINPGVYHAYSLTIPAEFSLNVYRLNKTLTNTRGYCFPSDQQLCVGGTGGTGGPSDNHCGQDYPDGITGYRGGLPGMGGLPMPYVNREYFNLYPGLRGWAGGNITIIAEQITLHGTIDASGENGQTAWQLCEDDAVPGWGGGGGGSGGNILLYTNELRDLSGTGQLIVKGGDGGDGARGCDRGSCDGDGGATGGGGGGVAGSGGSVFIYYSGPYTTGPTQINERYHNDNSPGVMLTAGDNGLGACDGRDCYNGPGAPGAYEADGLYSEIRNGSLEIIPITETSTVGIYACNDAIDNDADGFIDMEDADCLNNATDIPPGSCLDTGPLGPYSLPGQASDPTMQWFIRTFYGGSDACCGDDDPFTVNEQTLFNPSFENDDTFEGWSIISDPFSAMSHIESEVLTCQDGDFCINFNIPGGNQSYLKSSYYLQANVAYTIKFYIKRLAGSQVFVEGYATQGNYRYIYPSNEGQLLGTQLFSRQTISSNWIPMTINIPPFAEGGYFTIGLKNSGQSEDSFSLDNVSIVATATTRGDYGFVINDDGVRNWFCNKDLTAPSSVNTNPVSQNVTDADWRWWHAGDQGVPFKVHSTTNVAGYRTDFISNNEEWYYCGISPQLANQVPFNSTFPDGALSSDACMCPLVDTDFLTDPDCTSRSQTIALFGTGGDYENTDPSVIAGCCEGGVACYPQDSCMFEHYSYECSENPISICPQNCYFRDGTPANWPEDDDDLSDDFEDVPKDQVRFGGLFYGDRYTDCADLAGAGSSEYCAVNDYCVDGYYILSSEGLQCCYNEASGSNAHCEQFITPVPPIDCSLNEAPDGTRGELCPDRPEFSCQGTPIDAADTTANDYCCLGECLFQPSPSGTYADSKAESFICYAEPSTSATFGECCYGSDCENKDVRSVPRTSLREYFDKGHLFTGGSRLHTISSFDTLDNDVFAVDRVRVIYLSNAPSYVSKDNLPINLYTNWNSILFRNLEFDIAYEGPVDPLSLLLSVHDQYGSQISANLINISQYATSRMTPQHFTHIIIPLTSFGPSMDFIGSPPAKGGFEISYDASAGDQPLLYVDNFVLKPTSILESQYCTGPFKSWIPSLTPDVVDPNDFMSYGPYLYACDAQLSYGWTGVRCCGSRTVNPIQIEANREYYVDTRAGCFESTTVSDNTRVSDAIQLEEYRDILYFQSQFHGCERSGSFGVEESSGGLGQITLNTTSTCSAIGSYFCTERSYGNNLYKWSDEATGIPGDIVSASDRNTGKYAINLLLDGSFTTGAPWTLAGGTITNNQLELTNEGDDARQSNIPVTVGERYYLSYDVTGQSDITAFVSFYDGLNQIETLPETDLDGCYKFTTNNKDYYTLTSGAGFQSCSFVAPPDAETLTIKIEISAGGDSPRQIDNVQLTKETSSAFNDVQQYSSCCPSNYCWDGITCVPGSTDASFDGSDDYVYAGNYSYGVSNGLNQYVCKINTDDANWTYAYLKGTPENTDHGYCLDASQCWDGVCVDQGAISGTYVCQLQNGVGTWSVCNETTFGMKIDGDNDGSIDLWCLENNVTANSYHWLTLEDLNQFQEGVTNTNERIGTDVSWDDSTADCNWVTSHNMMLNGDFSVSDGWQRSGSATILSDGRARFRDRSASSYLQQTNVFVASDTFYTISANVQLETSTSSPKGMQIAIRFYDTDNNLIINADSDGTCSYQNSNYFLRRSLDEPDNVIASCDLLVPTNTAYATLSASKTGSGNDYVYLDNVRLELGRTRNTFEHGLNATNENLCDSTTDQCWSAVESNISIPLSILSQCCGDDGVDDDWNLYTDGTVGRCKQGVWDDGDYDLPDYADAECAYVVCSTGSECDEQTIQENYFCIQEDSTTEANGAGLYVYAQGIPVSATNYMGSCGAEVALRSYSLPYPVDGRFNLTRRDYESVHFADHYAENPDLAIGDCSISQYNVVGLTLFFTTISDSNYYYTMSYETEEQVSEPSGSIYMDGVCRQGACIPANDVTHCGPYDSQTESHVCDDYVCREASCDYVRYGSSNRFVPICNGDYDYEIENSRNFTDANLRDLNNCTDDQNDCDAFDAYMAWYVDEGYDRAGNHTFGADANQCNASAGNFNWGQMPSHVNEFINNYTFENYGDLSSEPPTLCTGGHCVCNDYAVCDNVCRENNEACEAGGELFCGEETENVSESLAPCCSAGLDAAPLYQATDNEEVSRYGCCEDALNSCWDGFTCVMPGTTRNASLPDGEEWLCAHPYGADNLFTDPNFEENGWTFNDVPAAPCEIQSSDAITGKAVVCHHQHNELKIPVTITQEGQVTFTGKVKSTESGPIVVDLLVNNTAIQKLTILPSVSWETISHTFTVDGPFEFGLRMHDCMDADSCGGDIFGTSIYFDNFNLSFGTTTWNVCDPSTEGDLVEGKQCYFFFDETGAPAHFWANVGGYEEKYDWYDRGFAYCLDQNSCFVSEFVNEGRSRCVDSGTYNFEDDHYCYEGSWTTRTARVASLLTSAATGYTLFCDDKQLALNTYDLSGYENAFCVVETQFSIVLGTALPADMNVSEFIGELNESVPSHLTEIPTHICENVTGTELEECTNLVADFEIHYDPATHIVAFTHGSDDLVDFFDLSVGEQVWDFIRGLFGWEPLPAPAFIASATNLEKLYLHDKTNEKITAVLEKRFDPTVGYVREYIQANYTEIEIPGISRISADVVQYNATGQLLIVNDTIDDALWQYLTASARPQNI